MPSILFLTAYPIDDASCRYRIHQFLPNLESAGYQCTVSTFASNRLWRALKSKGQLGVKLLETFSCGARRLKEFAKLARFDFVVIHREAFPFFQPAVENWILRHHPTVIFSFDDAVYAGHRDVSKLNHPLLYRWKHGRGYEAIIRGSAHVIAGNRILADYARRFNSQVSVMPTVVDCLRYPVKTPVAPDETFDDWLGRESLDRPVSLTHRAGIAACGCGAWRQSSVPLFWTARLRARCPEISFTAVPPGP